MARMERLAEILAADEVLEDRPGAYRGGRATGDLALEHVVVRVRRRSARRCATSRCEVPAGGCVAVMGPSGAGKSTLGALVARLYDPTAGRVLIDGRDLRDCALAWLREQVAIVLQETVLFTGTRARQHRLRHARPAGPRWRPRRGRPPHTNSSAALPQGYDTELGPQGVGLSGGQRQRIGIARTLLRDPPVLLLDEPTTGLDEASEAELLDGLRALIAGRTTILITHSRAARAARGPGRDARRRPDRAGRAPHGRRSPTRRCRGSPSCSTRARCAPCSTARCAPSTELGEVTVGPCRLQARRARGGALSARSRATRCSPASRARTSRRAPARRATPGRRGG